MGVIKMRLVIRLGVSNLQCGALEKDIDAKMNVTVPPWKVR